MRRKKIKVPGYEHPFIFCAPNTFNISTIPIMTLGYKFETSAYREDLINVLIYGEKPKCDYGIMCKEVTSNGFISIECEKGQVGCLINKTGREDKIADWIIGLFNQHKVEKDEVQG